jgi:hypothetical protein
MQNPSEILVFIFGAGGLLAALSAEVAFMGWLWVHSV